MIEPAVPPPAGPHLRPATPQDAAACADLYAPYVTDTAITFETEPPDPAEMARRIAAATETHAWLVATATDGPDPTERVIGYAYGGPFKARAAYRFACEVSVYLEPGRRRRGEGRALYAALLDHLAGRGYRTAAAGMTLPNEASVALHRAMGFRPVGTYRRIGWKLGRWHDVAWVQRDLLGPGDGGSAPTDTPAPLR